MSRDRERKAHLETSAVGLSASWGTYKTTGACLKCCEGTLNIIEFYLRVVRNVITDTAFAWSSAKRNSDLWWIIWMLADILRTAVPNLWSTDPGVFQQNWGVFSDSILTKLDFITFSDMHQLAGMFFVYLRPLRHRVHYPFLVIVPLCIHLLSLCQFVAYGTSYLIMSGIDEHLINLN